MDSATLQMLITLDRRIGKLQEIRRLIVEEFGEPVNASTDRRHFPPPHAHETTPPSGVRTGRKYQILDWLQRHGPATRGEIIKGTGLPPGTVGGYLSAESGLFETREGKWHAIPRVESAESITVLP